MHENDALALVLIQSNEAQAILERSNPDVGELKDAKKLFAKAAKNLGAAIQLLSEGCQTVKYNQEEGRV